MATVSHFLLSVYPRLEDHGLLLQFSWYSPFEVYFSESCFLILTLHSTVFSALYIKTSKHATLD